MFKLINISFLALIILASSIATQPSNFIYEKIEVGVPSQKNIFAPKSVSYVDEEATNQLKEQALSQVKDVYDQDKTVYTSLENDMNTFLTSLSDTKVVIDSNITEQSSNPNFNKDQFITSQLGSISNPFHFSSGDLKLFIAVDDEDLKRYTDQLLRELNSYLYDQIVTEDQLPQVKKDFEDKADTITYSSPRDIDPISTDMIQSLSSRIVVNFKLNQDETNKRKKEALAKVEPVYKQVKKGELIVSKGVIITEEQKEKLKQLGLTNSTFHYKDMIYQIPYVGIILFFYHLYCFRFFTKEFNSFRKYMFLMVCILCLLLLSTFIDDIRFFLVPLLTSMLMFTILWGRKFILPFSVIIGLLLYPGEYTYLATTIISGLSIALFYKPGGERMTFIKTGLIVGFIYFVSQIIFSVSIDKSLSEGSFDFSSQLWFLVSAFFASVITLGVLPLVENFLSVVTDFRLHEYTKLNHPLLKKLVLEAPGTFDHSIKVGNLAEMAADAINANGLLVRVAAYYHDLGKTKNPSYFIENASVDSNPHNALTPYESAQIILEHPLLSVKICKEHKLPEPIINLIASHHSDSVLQHIYKKAIVLDEQANIEDYRYKCPTPKSKEEGILMLSDSIEAYSRVLLEKNLNHLELEQAIRSSVLDKVKNGDLRHCSLSLKELEVVIATFVKYLTKANHKRIEYDTSDLQKKN